MVGRVALWGFGVKGNLVKTMIERGWRDSFRITAVFDVSFASMEEADRGMPVRDPERMPDAYRQGLFDGVMVCAFSSETVSRMRERLAEWGIPEVVPDNRAAFVRADEFGHEDTDLTVDRAGYRLHVLKGMRLARPLKGWGCYLYDRRGRILKNGWKDQVYYQNPEYFSFRPSPKTEEETALPGDHCLLAFPYSGNYWHFMFESLDQCFLLEEAGFKGTYIVPYQSFVKPLMRLAGVTEERLIPIDQLGPERVLLPERVFTLEAPDRRKRISAPVLEALSRKILRNLEKEEAQSPEREAASGSPVPDASGPSRLLICRTGSRKLILEDAVSDELGFRKIVPEELSVEEQIRAFYRADIVISPHGANTANVLFMRPGTALIETFPANYVNPLVLEYCVERGIRYLAVAEDPEDAERENGGPFTGALEEQNRDYRIRPERIRAAVRTMLTAADGSR
ncbi:MAG: glycosyltransferase family 61 protein [Lachnospiraceae bacterium]|nr:glycosyltransferase family 61 protein [Lachnospiraceae bacterium]